LGMILWERVVAVRRLVKTPEFVVVVGKRIVARRSGKENVGGRGRLRVERRIAFGRERRGVLGRERWERGYGRERERVGERERTRVGEREKTGWGREEERRWEREALRGGNWRYLLGRCDKIQ